MVSFFSFCTKACFPPSPSALSVTIRNVRRYLGTGPLYVLWDLLRALARTMYLQHYVLTPIFAQFAFCTMGILFFRAYLFKEKIWRCVPTDGKVTRSLTWSAAPAGEESIPRRLTAQRTDRKMSSLEVFYVSAGDTDIRYKPIDKYLLELKEK